MLLHAHNSESSLKDKNVLSWVFNAATANDMSAIGSAFARVIGTSTKKGFRNAGVRIGLSADPAMGKTTFAKGILGAIPLEQAVEELDYGQGLWRVKGGTWLRLYDAALGLKHICLASYWFNDVSGLEPKLTDIVEHAGADRNNQLFDCLVLIKKADEPEAGRNLTIIPTKKLAKSAGFQKFLTEAAPYIRPNS